jgi:hypothetical protein
MRIRDQSDEAHEIPPITRPRHVDKVLKAGKMVQSISSSSSAQAIEAAQSKPAQQAPPQKTETPGDSVHLSDAAKQAAAGDADHDGDSH